MACHLVLSERLSQVTYANEITFLVRTPYYWKSFLIFTSSASHFETEFPIFCLYLSTVNGKDNCWCWSMGLDDGIFSHWRTLPSLPMQQVNQDDQFSVDVNHWYESPYRYLRVLGLLKVASQCILRSIYCLERLKVSMSRSVIDAQCVGYLIYCSKDPGYIIRSSPDQKGVEVTTVLLRQNHLVWYKLDTLLLGLDLSFRHTAVSCRMLVTLEYLGYVQYINWICAVIQLKGRFFNCVLFMM